MTTNMNDELSTTEIHERTFYMPLSPPAKLVLVFAMTASPDVRIAGITGPSISKWLKMPLGTARRALKELRNEGLASYHTIHSGGRLYHEWKFRWPTDEEVRESLSRPEVDELHAKVNRQTHRI